MENYSYVYVKNLHEGDRKPESKGCSSWREYWEQETDREFSDCSRKGCTKPAEDGSHVIKTRSEDKKWYIVPLCHACNHPSNVDEFQVRENDLVPVSN